ncbi:MAG: SDR family NAD(P)-dependent oxidoreductase [Hymenobacteraceae bacterium]|nr:SDR family NAD(P)-dependent oxidoreductase [Hymenobacteraceae bacterium]MDX5397873.1 SDR family NAD(P)-dependent oxidoreductase [Hymenobacteraceae bacterium]MDX5443261.1 SDR family NAD(P)-dependent oxidoreductase [Hymenobacteraceae bacterium]MDX5513944.1 SDR family NAD(P)-dependent oxidoreductase [Hymenobacteraceae bacterium]
MSKIAFITGATSGIGRATAVALAKAGFSIIAAGRRQDRLEQLASEINFVPVKTLVFDVRDRQAVEQAVKSLPENWQKIDVLVNNAGNAHGLAPIHEGDVSDWDAMIDINVKGLLYVSKAIIPLMVEQGHIVNIGSIAGKEVYANGNVYCASKHAVGAITKSMRIDLLPKGIKVSEVNPGLVQTEFSEVRFKGDKERADAVYKGYQPLLAEDIADIIQFVVTRPPHVNLAEVLVLPAAQAAATIVDKKS